MTDKIKKQMVSHKGSSRLLTFQRDLYNLQICRKYVFGVELICRNVTSGILNI